MSERNEYDDLFSESTSTAVPANGVENEYDALVAEGSAPQPQTPSSGYPPATGRTGDALRAYEQSRGADALATSARLAADRNPAEHANVLKMSDYTGLPRDTVERNMAEVRSLYDQKKIDTKSLIENSPTLAIYLSRFDNMAVHRNEIAALQGLEWWTGPMTPSGQPSFIGGERMQYGEGAFGRALKVGGAQRERAEIGRQLMLSGGDPAANARLAELDAFLAEDYGRDAHGTFGRMATGTLETLASLSSGVVRGLSLGAAAGAATTLAGPEALPLVPEAFGAGMLSGVGLDTFDQESGSAYIDIVEAMKERGGAVNHRAAARAAVAVGTVNAAVEVLGSKVAASLFPFLSVFATGEQAAAKLGGVSVRKATARAAAGYIGTLAEETATEIAQQGVTSLGREVAIGATGGTTNFAGIGAELGQEAVGALEAFPLLILPGFHGELSHELSASRAGIVAQQRLESLGRIAQEIKSAQAYPAGTAEFADAAARANGHPDSVLVSADAWTKLFQSKNIDPASVAAEMGVAQEYATAKETGGFISIPFGEYVAKIAPSEYHDELIQDSKFYQESMTPREAKEYQKALQALPEAVGAETAAATKESSRSPVYIDRFNQLTAIGVSETDADHYARLHEAYFKTQAQRTGLTPEELQSVFPLSIQAGEVVPGPDVSLAQPVAVPSFAPVSPGSKNMVGDFGNAKLSITPSTENPQTAVVNLAAGRGLKESLPQIASALKASGFNDVAFDVADYDNRAPARQRLFDSLRGQLKALNEGAQGGPRARIATVLEDLNRQISGLDVTTGEAYRAEANRAVPPGETETQRNERLGAALRASRSDASRLINARAWAEMVVAQSNDPEIVARFFEWADQGFPERRGEGVGSPPAGTPERRISPTLKTTLFQERRQAPRSIPLSGLDPEQQRIEDAYRKVRAEGGRLDPALVQTVRDLARSNASDAEIVNAITDAGGKPEDYAPLYRNEQQLQQEARGSITFSKAGSKGEARGALDKFLSRFGITPREFTITLSQAADASTFLHETGHYFLETFADLAYSDKATDQTRADYETLLNWFGVKTRDEVATEHHEKFARAFESYLQDGKAPSLGLVRVFARFSAWLKSLYRNIIGQGGQLSPEVRGVMDRMIATDEQIQAATTSSVYVPMFHSAEEAGMTPEKFDAYNAKAEEAYAEAQGILNSRIADEQRRETKAWWQEERAKVEEQVAKEVNAGRPVQAYRYFTEGALPEGADPQVFADENGKPLKLSLADVKRDYPHLANRVRGELGRTGLTATGGVHPDYAAPLFGYASGDELLQSLLNTEPPDRTIARKTDATMIERHGDVLHDGTLPQAAEEAVRDSKARLSQLLQELDVLNRKAGNPRVNLTEADLQASAFKSVREGKVRDLNPAAYQQAERTAATNAIRANKAGKYDEAVEWQRRRLLNFALSREATAASKEAESAAKFLKNSEKDATRARLGKVGGTYQEQQDALLERFDFRKRSLKAIDRSQRLADWVTEQRAKGFDPVVPAKLLDEAFRTNWKDLSVNDLLDLRDTVKNIQHQAKRKSVMMLAGKERAFEAVKTEAVEGIQANVPDPGRAKISETNAGAIARLSKFGNNIDALAVKLEELALQMDGENPNGVYSQVLVHALADAQAAEKDLGLEVARKLLALYEALPKAERTLLKTGTVYLKSIDQTLTYQDLFGIAANYGNESNYAKLLGGYQTEEGNLIPWTPEVIEEALSHLTSAHWDYIQGSWDILQSLWPAAQALEMRRTGLAPPEIPRRPFVKRGKQYAGGYYPVIAHPDFSQIQAEQMTGPDGGPFERGYVAAITPHGHLIERTAAKFPLSLNIHRLPGHAAQSIHDVTHREAIINAWRFITEPEIAQEIKHRMGVPMYKAILERLRRVANARGMGDFAGDYLGKTQSALAAAVMGYKVTVATQNFANLAIAKQVVGARAYASAATEMIRNRQQVMEFIHESSGEMRHRMTTRDNEVRREFERAVSGDSWTQQVRRSGYLLSSVTNALIDYPTWLASYRNETANGVSHEKAVRIADSVIRTNFGAGGVKDLAAFQDHTVLRYLSMFSGWFNAAYNAQRKVIRETKGLAAEGRYAKAAQHAIANEFWRVAVMAVASELLSGRGPKDGQDAWEWTVEQIALYHASMLPIVRDIANAIDRKADPRFVGLESLGEQVVRAVQADVKSGKALLHGRPNADFIGPTAQLAATVAGLPAAQAEITGGYIWDVLSGKAKPKSVGNFLHDLVFRRTKGRR